MECMENNRLGLFLYDLYLFRYRKQVKKKTLLILSSARRATYGPNTIKKPIKNNPQLVDGGNDVVFPPCLCFLL